jgi:hypothetical protein
MLDECFEMFAANQMQNYTQEHFPKCKAMNNCTMRNITKYVEVHKINHTQSIQLQHNIFDPIYNLLFRGIFAEAFGGHLGQQVRVLSTVVDDLTLIQVHFPQMRRRRRVLTECSAANCARKSRRNMRPSNMVALV